jgi:ribonucleoside-diphosphate reductase alpha chain
MITKNAITVLERRYLKKDSEGNIIETPEQMFRRVAYNIAIGDLSFNLDADIDGISNTFYNMMNSLEFLPNSPTLMNAGRDLQQLSACFVLPIADSMEDIFTTIKNTALIHKSGGGTGFSFSRLRPVNSVVASTSGVSSGPISFMHVFDSATEAVKQGGTRRGANMGILRIDHPDIIEFIECKQNETDFNNFNISIALTEEFIKCVENNEDYELINPHTKKSVKKLNAKSVFEKIIKSAWTNGEPGIIFIDRINRDNPTPHIGEIESTNPCGEQPLLPFESCNLGSINLSLMVNDKAEVDYEKLSKTIHNGVHFLDNVIEMNRFPITEIEEMTKGNRKIGLGAMGFADLLIRLGIPYTSEKALQTAREVMSFIDLESKKASARLGEERGVFPNYKGSIFDEANESSNSPYKGWKLRNATTTTIAPTGTISIISNSSSGIEPLFAVSYVRTVMDNDELIEVHPAFKEIAESRGFYSDELMKKIAQQGHLDDMEEIPEDIRNVFVTAHNVTPEQHIMMQSIFQKHVDNAVSKTINFDNSATEEDVLQSYLLAARTGCKGLTIYRDGSRQGQVLSTGSTYTKEKTEYIEPRPRPEVTHGTTKRIATGCGTLYVTINECDKGKPFEIFTHMGKAGGCAASQAEAIGRLVSLSLRTGIKPDDIVKQLVGISCHMTTWDSGTKILSCSDAISKAIASYIKTDIKDVEQPLLTGEADLCPECGGQVEHSDGCMVCKGCGFSKCF